MTDAMLRDSRAGVEESVVVRHKRDWDTLRLTDKRGAEFLVWTAPGGGCLALWNILLMLVAMQKGAQDG